VDCGQGLFAGLSPAFAAIIQSAIQPGSVEGVSMTAQSDSDAIASDLIPDTASIATRTALVRWLLAYGTFGVPQAAGPIAFALLAIPLTGDPADGAAIVLAITIAQVVGAAPIARFGRTHNAVSFLKTLVGIRTLALAAIGLLAAVGVPFSFLLVAAALAGLEHDLTEPIR
jgi:hypothetical protein